MIKSLRNSYSHCEGAFGATKQSSMMRLLRSLRSVAMMAICIILAGCQTARPTDRETTQETLDAVGQVAGALSGKELTEAEKRRIVQDLKNDKEAQSAMKSISGALEVRQIGIKYCPVDGKRFGIEVEECPVHKIKLKELTD